MPDVVVAGAGRCGLRIATALARRSLSVTVVERLPVSGGQEPERPEVDVLAREAATAGARLMTGTMAVEWDGRGVSALGVQGAVRLEAAVLVVATGSRPATVGELMIAGDRCAGVLPGSAALHLMESGLVPGMKPAVLGGGSLARSCALALAHQGVDSIAFVVPDGLSFKPRPRDRVYEGWSVQAVHGASRVSALTLVSNLRRERLLCDALILAHRRFPMRNIEGAVMPGAGIVFCQTSNDPKQAEAVEQASARALNETIALLGASRRGGARPSPATEVTS